MKATLLGASFGLAVACNPSAFAAPINPPPLDGLIVVATDDMKMSPREYGLLFDDGWGLRRFLEVMEVFPPNSIESIGRVEDLLVDENGRIFSALIELDGLLSLGEDLINVPWHLLDYQAGERLVVPLRLPELEHLPTILAPTRATFAKEIFGVATPIIGPDEGVWRATAFLRGVYELASGEAAVIRNVVIGSDGHLRAIVVTPASN